MKRQNKKGFTIIELVIVIAVIAILASVLIPVFSNIVDKANVSKDTQLVRNLNSALKTDLEKHETMYDALQAAEEYGYDIDKINASATDNEILWDSKNDCFVYLNGGKIEYIPNTKTYNNVADHEYWMIANSIPATQKYSIYAGKKFTATDVTVSVGFDAGEKTGVNVNVVTDETIDLVIRANSVADTYKITAPDANIKFFGTAGEVDVVAVKDNSLHIYGAVEFLQVKAGRVVAENTAEIKGIHIADAAAKVVVESNAVVETVTKETGVANVTVEGYTETIAEVDAETAKAGAKLFAAGNGTEALPFIIETVEQFKNINEVYESGYNYFKAAENAEFDATDLGRINLNGSFDGNGATFKNANGYIFATVGTCENAVDELPVVIKNFSVVFVDGMGVVRCCGAKTLTYENVNVLGYLLCDWNAGAFLRYGTANVHETGFDYTVNFVKCSSNAKIYSTSNAYSAILIGHTYPGAGKATINIDANTEANILGSKLYYTGTDKNPFGYKYCCIASNATIYVDGKETVNDKYYENIVLVPATNTLVKEDTGYVVTTAEDTTKLVVTINFQYTLYTDDTYATCVPKNNGVGGMLDTIIELEVPANTTQNVFALFESVEIVTGADEFDYEIKDGKLTIYVIADNDNIDGWVTLNVEQCTADSNIPTWKDSIRIAQRSAKNNPEAEWIVK